MSQVQGWMSVMSWDWMVVQKLLDLGFAIVPKLLWAIVLLLVTRLVRQLIQTLARQMLVHVEPTLKQFLIQMVGILVWVVGGVAALNTVGIETTTIVAIVGATGLAIGLALQNSLSHFAAGILLISFRPFEVGDSIECSGVVGTVLTIGLFSTAIVTADNTMITVPNGTLFGGTLKNFTAMKTRRVDFKVELGDRPIRATSAEILNLVGRHPQVLATPKPMLQLVGLGMSDRTIVWVRAWCPTGEYDAVKGDLLLTVKEYLERG